MSGPEAGSLALFVFVAARQISLISASGLRNIALLMLNVVGDMYRSNFCLIPPSRRRSKSRALVPPSPLPSSSFHFYFEVGLLKPSRAQCVALVAVY